MQQIQTDVLELTRNLLLGEIKNKQKKKTSLYLQRYSDSFFCSVSLRLMRNMHTHTQSLSSHTPALLQFPGPAYWPCVLSGSRALAGHGASRPAEWGRKTSPETWIRKYRQVKWEKERGGEKQTVEYRECNLHCCHSDEFPTSFLFSWLCR